MWSFCLWVVTFGGREGGRISGTFNMLEDCYKGKRNSQFSMFIVNRTTNGRFRAVTGKSQEKYSQTLKQIVGGWGRKGVGSVEQ